MSDDVGVEEGIDNITVRLIGVRPDEMARQVIAMVVGTGGSNIKELQDMFSDPNIRVNMKILHVGGDHAIIFTTLKCQIEFMTHLRDEIVQRLTSVIAHKVKEEFYFKHQPCLGAPVSMVCNWAILKYFVGDTEYYFPHSHSNKVFPVFQRILLDTVLWSFDEAGLIAYNNEEEEMAEMATYDLNSETDFPSLG